MPRGIIQDHDPNGLSIPLKQELQVRAYFLMPRARMDGIESLPGGIFQTAEEGVPGIRHARRIDAQLRALRDIPVANVRAPMPVGGIEIDQSRGFGRLTPIGLRQIVTRQRAIGGFFLINNSV